jgi:hypothetical protein
LLLGLGGVATTSAVASGTPTAPVARAGMPTGYASSDPACIDRRLDSRSISFENPRGGRGAGGTAANGRKGAPSRLLAPGERVVLAEIDGPGRLRHIWMTFPPGPPEQMRAVWLEVFYDGLGQPSVSVPCLDFFGLPHGRAAPYDSALTSVHEARGFNSYFPLPFRRHVRIELTNSGTRPLALYYQVDYTLEEFDHDGGYLHVPFRRENPTTLKRDFVIAAGLDGPGRFLGCVVGIRVLKDDMRWYGEGEVKFYRDGDETLPTICGTGLEDYVGSAWGLGPHTAHYAGVPIHVAPPAEGKVDVLSAPMPDFVGFYRWHLVDPIVFQRALKVTIQQIGGLAVLKGEEQLLEALKQKYTPAGAGWTVGGPLLAATPIHALTIAERVDDYSAAAFLYCREPQAVPRLDVTAAVADIALREYEERPGLL